MTPTIEAKIGRARRVLVVEDELLIAMELESLLREDGYVVHGPVATIPRALARLDEILPDAALLDVNLNGRRSTPVAAALAARGIPFVLLTGYGRQQLTEPELRDARILSKPVSHQQLRQALSAMLADSGPTGSRGPLTKR